jgi:hypothetical protein
VAQIDGEDGSVIDMSDETEITTRVGNRPAPTLARLCELLNFDPTTCQFLWRVQRGRARVGDVAGTGHHSGFRRVGIDGGSYRADRLARLFVSQRNASDRGG